jgi:hypothetical protein
MEKKVQKKQKSSKDHQVPTSDCVQYLLIHGLHLVPPECVFLSSFNLRRLDRGSKEVLKTLAQSQAKGLPTAVR